MATWAVGEPSSSTSARRLLAVELQQFGRAQVARDQHGLLRQRRLPPRAPGEMAQQPVGQIVEIGQPLAQIGIEHLGHAGPGVVLHLQHRALGGEAARRSPRPAAARQPRSWANMR